MKQLNVRQIEDSLNRIPAVFAARVMLNGSTDEIEEIHIMAAPSRNPKQIVRDVESLLLVSFRTRIDYRRVSLVQVSPEDLVSYFRRPKLMGVRQETGAGLAVEVHLAYANGTTAVGRAQLGTDGQDACQVAAAATITALSAIVDGQREVVLKGAEVAALNGHQVVVVHLSRQTTEQVEHLLGVSMAEPDVVHGAVRATLDAVNRRFF